MSAIAQDAINQAAGAIDAATKAATDEALKALKDIKADTEDAMRDLPPSARNILTLVEGIDKGDWEKMLEGGGPIIAKVVITTIINVILTPAFAPIIGPVVDVMVQNRADLIFGILKAVKESRTSFWSGRSSSNSTCKRWSRPPARSSRKERSGRRLAAISPKRSPASLAPSAMSWV